MRIRVELKTGIAGAVFTTLQSTLAELSHGQYWKGKTGMHLRARIYHMQIVNHMQKRNSSTPLLSSVMWKLQISSKFYSLFIGLNKIIFQNPSLAANKKRGGIWSFHWTPVIDFNELFILIFNIHLINNLLKIGLECWKMDRWYKVWGVKMGTVW